MNSKQLHDVFSTIEQEVTINKRLQVKGVIDLGEDKYIAITSNNDTIVVFPNEGRAVEL